MKSQTGQRESNWSAQWIAGIAAVGATGGAQAALVQVNLMGNSVTAGGGSTLAADLTDNSFLGTGLVASNQLVTMPVGFTVFGGQVSYGGGIASALDSFAGGVFQVNGPNRFSTMGSASAPGGSAKVAFEITFSINGQATDALLFADVIGADVGTGVFLLSIVWDDEDESGAALADASAVFNDGTVTVLGSSADGAGVTTLAEANAVPEPSSLALLAMGAAGIMTRRQRKKLIE